MEKLNPDWILESPIDLEYKQYVLLAYLKSVKENYKIVQLYPFLGDLIWHYERIKQLKNDYENFDSLFPKKLSGLNMETLSLSYEKINDNHALIEEIQDIILYSIPKMETYIREGKEIYDFIEKQIQLIPIGIQPLNKTEGYVLFKEGNKKQVKVFEYRSTLFSSFREQYRGISFQFVKNYTLKISNSIDQIKMDLIHTFPKLPNPAAFLFESRMDVPFNHTFLPIAKRSLMRYVSC